MEHILKKILVPVDGSDPSDRALDWALHLALVSKAEVLILEVVEDFGPLPGRYEAPPEGKDRVQWLSEKRFEHAHKLLDHSEVKWTRKVVEGYPAEEICKMAEKEKSDLIVIGSRGRSAIGRFIVGSVSDRVVHHAPCAVTVVR
ncbi:universal stress protein UspA [Leptospira perolatii]|uniref:Universal stress protein UspA n=1 Tax=Leptospira perolatii TaxID=2023191 RepID=A0A2M9ZLE4_9LEPT|nr:universal stress protein [Leptospira perolatii]PJZ70239.1 universal stress protein UspA [Leptospira perolatii]PJZ72877.1 universal stress protein UspA [Leptospira perolatii]